VIAIDSLQTSNIDHHSVADVCNRSRWSSGDIPDCSVQDAKLTISSLCVCYKNHCNIQPCTWAVPQICIITHPDTVLPIRVKCKNVATVNIPPKISVKVFYGRSVVVST